MDDSDQKKQQGEGMSAQEEQQGKGEGKGWQDDPEGNAKAGEKGGETTSENTEKIFIRKSAAREAKNNLVSPRMKINSTLCG